MRVIYVLSLLAILSSSCDTRNYIIDDTQTLSDKGWAYVDTLEFKANIEDTTTLYNLILTLNHSTQYARQNIYTQIHTTFPDGQRFSKQVGIDLADKTGKWYGDCSSEACTLEVPIQSNAFFNQAGNYTFTIEQYTRIDPLPSVQKVGFKIEHTGQKKG